MAQVLSLRSILLCAVFFLSANVLAVSAVLGVDLGTEYLKAVLVKPGTPLDIVLTKDSRRKETSAVNFKPSRHALAEGEYPERAFGSDAMALAARFPSDVYPNLKTLLALSVDDLTVQEYMAKHPALQIEARGNHDTAAFKSKAFGAEEEAWMVEELLAMELQSVQRNAEAVAGSSIKNAVFTIPPFYTIEERRAVDQAAKLVGLNVLSQISDGMAVGLNYATSRTFPTVNEGGKPEINMIFDMGAGSTTATIMKFQGRSVKDVGKFNKTIQEIQTLGAGWDRTLGGDALNYLIVDDMVAKFVDSPKAKKASVTAEGVQAHGRAMAKLLKEAERLRHILSANSDSQGSFEGLYEEIDFKYKITRAEFEKMAEAHADRVSATIQNALDLAELDISQVDSVILHGGASRTPFVQKQLEGVVGSDKIRANVNSDEAAVFGAGFRAAQISPSFRVKEFVISDGASYPSGMKWTSPQGKSQQQRLWTARSLLGSTPKEVTFANHDDLSIDFYQQVLLHGEPVDKTTATLATKNLTASVSSLVEKHGCTDSDIQFKVQLRLNGDNGEVEVSKASVECEAVDTEKGGIVDGVKNLFGFGKNKDQEGEEEEVESVTGSTDDATTASTDEAETSSTTTSTEATGSADAHAQNKVLVSIPVAWKIERVGEPQLAEVDVTKAKQRIQAFEASDKARRLREEALNQLEGFTYKIRDMLERESFIEASTDAERSELEAKAADASEWLSDDGADAPRDELKARLKVLKDIVGPIEKRAGEAAKRPELVEALRTALDTTTPLIKSMKDKIAEAEAMASSHSSKYASTTSSGDSSSVTEAPSGDFEGLEDDEPASATTTEAPEVLPPPLYTAEDLELITEISQTTLQWLEEKIAEQAKLPSTADPVLLVSEIEARIKKLESAGSELAMRAIKASAKGKKGEKKPSKSKKKGPSGTESAESGPTIDFNGEKVSAEEIEEMIRKLTEEKQAKESGSTHDEL